MDIKLELLKNKIQDVVLQNFSILDIDADEIADTSATKILNQIKIAIEDEKLSDNDVVERIVTIFEENNISVGARHDFG